MARRHAPPLYEEITQGVRIRVRPKFMHDESEPSRGRFMWSYTVDVENESEQTWTILRRHWRIVQTPTLMPGERFSYTSGAPLAAPSGMMSGTYDLKDESGFEIVATIPVFSLDSPYDTSLPS